MADTFHHQSKTMKTVQCRKVQNAHAGQTHLFSKPHLTEHVLGWTGAATFTYWSSVHCKPELVARPLRGGTGGCQVLRVWLKSLDKALRELNYYGQCRAKISPSRTRPCEDDTIIEFIFDCLTSCTTCLVPQTHGHGNRREKLASRLIAGRISIFQWQKLNFDDAAQ